MKKSVAVLLVSLMLFGALAFISANVIGDLWTKLNGNAISSSIPIDAVCTDSDNGDMPFVKGAVEYTYKGAITLSEDKCNINGKDLVEYFCTDNRLDSKQYACEKGCKDGACLPIGTAPSATVELTTAPATTSEVGIANEEPIQEIKLSLWQRFLNFITGA